MTGFHFKFRSTYSLAAEIASKTFVSDFLLLTLPGSDFFPAFKLGFAPGAVFVVFYGTFFYGLDSFFLGLLSRALGLNPPEG